ncbi:MAG: hypothetical protein KJ060_04890 [Candidatus Hydrogenedentes bacterium]|nr:hypothetical protein [Candidatus Hydrogenedentota bacterium]
MSLSRIHARSVLFCLVIGVGAVQSNGVTLHDTGQKSFKPLTPIAMSSPSMWERIPAGQTDHTFEGDAVILSDTIALVVRPEATGADVHYKGKAGWHQYASLVAVGEQAARSVTDIKIVSNNADAVTIAVTYKTLSSGDVTVQFRINDDADEIVTLPGAGAKRLAMEAPTRFAVLPTSSGEGLLVDATAVSGAEHVSAGETAVLHMLGHGDAIVMSHWTSDDNSVSMNVSGMDSGRQIVSSEVPLAGGAVTTTVFALQSAWGERPTDDGAGGVRIGWRWPSPAPWMDEADSAGGRLAQFEAGAELAAGGGAVPFATAFDTGTASDTALSNEAMAGYRRWDKIPEEDTSHGFLGDAVVMNDKVALVVRQTGTVMELYARRGNSFSQQALLSPQGGSGIVRLTDVKLVNNAQDSVVLDAVYLTENGDNVGIRSEITMGQVSVKTEALERTKQLRVEAPCRFAILPDFFADDIVIDARDIGSDTAALPSENFLLHMVDGGNAIVLTVWENREQEVNVNLSGAVSQRTIDSSEITYGADGAAWVAVLYDNGIWHEREVGLQDKDKVIPLNWQVPFPALWRVDWRRSDEMTDSWEMLSEVAEGKFKKHGLFEESEDSWTIQDWWGSGERTRISSGLGRFTYPCWVDLNGRGYLQPLKEAIEFQGPAIIYPINRLAATPLDKHTLVDVVRGSLGVGPCEYILDVEGQEEVAAGWPTCTVQDVLDEIYEKNQQAQERAEIEQALKNVVDFIAVIRKRIDEYEAFGKDMETYLTQAKSENPAHTAFLDRMIVVTKQIEEDIAARREAIKSVEFAQQLVDQFRAEVLPNTSADAFAACQKYTAQWVDIGGNQDELVAECRMIVKVLRQRAGMALAQDASLEPIAEEIRNRTQEVLRQPVNYEAARH